MKKQRLDKILVQNKIVSSIEKARELIIFNRIYVNKKIENKPETLFNINNININIKKNINQYVSRGGIKLEKAIKKFNILLKNKICLDVGCSTGGFTECILRNKATKIYAIDIGYGQLDLKLRNNINVICMERTDIRCIKYNKSIKNIDFISVDVSFISLKKILIYIYKLLKYNGESICLIKPQFEIIKKNKYYKNGIVSTKIHKKIIKKVIKYTKNMKFVILNIMFSPIKGTTGNIEYFMYIKKNNNKLLNKKINIDKLINNANYILNNT